MCTWLTCALSAQYTYGVLSLIGQVEAERVKRGWSVQRLLDESGLEIDRSGLHRRLKEEHRATTSECEALAAAMAMTLTFPSKRKRRAA